MFYLLSKSFLFLTLLLDIFIEKIHMYICVYLWSVACEYICMYVCLCVCIYTYIRKITVQTTMQLNCQHLRSTPRLYVPPWWNSHFSRQSNSLLILLKNNFLSPFCSCFWVVSSLFAVPVPVASLRFWATHHSWERSEVKWFSRAGAHMRTRVYVCPHLLPLWRAANQTSREICLNPKEQKGQVDLWKRGLLTCGQFAAP